VISRPYDQRQPKNAETKLVVSKKERFGKLEIQLVRVFWSRPECSPAAAGWSEAEPQESRKKTIQR